MVSKNENFFALLGDEDEEDPVAAALAAKKSSKSTPKKEQPLPPPQQQQQQQQQHTAKLPSKPLPPAEAVRIERETQGERGRGGRRGRGRESFLSGGESSGDRDRDRDSAGAFSDHGGRGGRGGRGPRGSYNRADHNGYGDKSFEGGGRGRGRGRRFYPDEKRGAAPPETVAVPASQDEAVPPPEAESVASPDSEKIPEPKKEEDPEEKEMTLDEYEKIVQEKRKSLGSQQRVEERKVEADNELKAMQLVDRKSDDGVFIKLGSDKEKLRKKDSAEKDEKTKKAININEFLKPAERDRYSPRGARGRGRSTGAPRYAASGGDDNGALSPSIDSPHDFPELGKKM